MKSDLIGYIHSKSDDDKYQIQVTLSNTDVLCLNNVMGISIFTITDVNTWAWVSRCPFTSPEILTETSFVGDNE